MKQEEAVSILEALLDGADPITGETLPSNHICQESDVMRALHTAIIALNASIASRRRKPSRSQSHYSDKKNEKLNVGRPWTDMDNQQLISLFFRDASVDEICRVLQRRPRGVYNQLAYFGLDPEEPAEEQPEEIQPAQFFSDKHGKPWTLEEHKWLMAAWDKGCTVNEMSDYLGRTAYAIRLQLDKCGLYDGGMTAKNEPPPWTELDTKELFRMVDEGCTTDEMAKRFGRTVRAMEARLFYLGLSKKAPMLF